MNIGTRFLASVEAPISDGWKRAIVAAVAEDAIKFEAWNGIMPQIGRAGYGTVPRVLRTPFVETWGGQPDEVKRCAEQLREEIMGALREGRSHEVVPFTGQTAGLIHDVLPAGEIVRRIMADAEGALTEAADLMAERTTAAWGWRGSDNSRHDRSTTGRWCPGRAV